MSCCLDSNILTALEGYEVCINCGSTSPYFLVSSFENNEIKITKQHYERKNYFKRKLRLLQGLTSPITEEYETIVHILNFDPLITKIKQNIKKIKKKHIIKYFIQIEIHHLIRQLLKLLNYAKYYKFTYNIINYIFNIRCFDIKNNEFEKLVLEWFNFELKFKLNFKNKRNIINYNITLYHILKKNNIANYDLLFLPINKNRINALIKSRELIISYNNI